MVLCVLSCTFFHPFLEAFYHIGGWLDLLVGQEVRARRRGNRSPCCIGWPSVCALETPQIRTAALQEGRRRRAAGMPRRTRGATMTSAPSAAPRASFCSAMAAPEPSTSTAQVRSVPRVVADRQTDHRRPMTSPGSWCAMALCCVPQQANRWLALAPPPPTPHPRLSTET
jgi:hypothetical protein